MILLSRILNQGKLERRENQPLDLTMSVCTVLYSDVNVCLLA